MSCQNLTLTARASPSCDARRPRPNGVRSWLGLPAQGRDGLKKQVRIRFGTLNIGTLTGRARELADALKHRFIDIACLQETKWKGSKSREIGEGFKLLYNGERNSQNGVGIVVSSRFRDNVTAVYRVSDRIMSIKIGSGTTVLRVVSCYAPQTGSSDEDKDGFWRMLADHLQSIGPDEQVVVGGDLNGHVGSERHGYERYHGGYGYGVRNEDGNRILECVEAHDLVIANTFFKKRQSHLITYSSGGRVSQIDYWLLRRCHLKLVTDAKVIPSDTTAPQHRLLVMDLKLDLGQLQKVRRTGMERIKWWRLPEQKEQLVEALESVQVDLDRSASDIWNDAVTQIHRVTSSILGKTKPGKRFIDKQTWWWNEDVQKSVKTKKEAFKKWSLSRDEDDYEHYRECKKFAKQAVASAKANYYNRVYEELDLPGGANAVYRLAKARHHSSLDIQGHISQIKDTENRVLRDSAAILQRWRDHFNNICNEEFPHPPFPSADPIQGPVPPISSEEVEEAVHKMKNGKATGPDDISSEVWKLLGYQGVEILEKLFNKIVDENNVPQVWSTSTTVPIWKGKGDVAECSNYRPIRLLCQTMKIFERIVDARLRNIVKISANQCGFVKGCGTTDAIHAVRLLLERHREKCKPIHLSFLDLEKAFDRVPHNLIWYALRSHNVPEVYVKWVQLLYSNVTSIVKCPVGNSPPFAINVGVHQGSTLSPFLFVLCMDTVTAEIQAPHPWSLLYADDVFLAGETREELQQRTQQWKDRLEEFGLRLNIGKTEYMECGPQTDGTIAIDGVDLQKVTRFKYLGSQIDCLGDSVVDARSRVTASWLKWRQVTGVLCDRRMPIRLKSKIYKSVVRPVALYGSECWPTTTKHAKALHAMEMKMLRWSLGFTLLDHKRNEDVRASMGVAPINEKMREHRLRWYGHVVRSNENSVAKTGLELVVPGRRPRGRPRKRYLDQVREDMRCVEITEDDALDRMVWRRAIRIADPAVRD